MNTSSNTDQSTSVLPPALTLRRRMGGRDIHEPHRATSPLEALFDLTTVVAVAAAAAKLHHGIMAEHYALAATQFLLSFFCIWWSWMNFAWFSSAYDTDDIGFRLATTVQIIGVLLIAAGIAQEDDVVALQVSTGGFTVMRLGLVSMWLRAAREHPERHRTCLRYAIGLTAMQSIWIARAFIMPTEWWWPGFVGMPFELLVPVWAERAGNTPWHPHHIAERYSLFTIILLGECMVGASNAINGVLQTQGWSVNMMVVSLSIVALIVALWWVYFLVPFAQVLHQRRERGFLWGYGHAFVFLALAVLGGVLEVVADALKAAPAAAHGAAHEGAHGGATPLLAIGLTAATVLAYLIALWWLGGVTTRRQERSFLYLLPSILLAGIAIAAVAVGLPLPWGLALLVSSPAALIASAMIHRQRRPEGFAVR